MEQGGALVAEARRALRRGGRHLAADVAPDDPDRQQDAYDARDAPQPPGLLAVDGAGRCHDAGDAGDASGDAGDGPGLVAARAAAGAAVQRIIGSTEPGWRSHPELRWRPARDGRRRARGRARGGPGGRSLAAEPGRRPAGGCRRRALRGRGRELRGGQSPRAGGRRAPARDEEPRGRSPAVRPSWRPARDCRRRIPGWVACECCEGGPHRPAVRAVLRRRRHRPRPGLRTGAGEAARIVGLGWRVPRVPRG
mmetsp:Transcript_52893/g.142589  ORF Transcript_52893/g.142589 Transcript_52893/m.142589 type:complete len:252 (+) Transcript_52893:1301-2056(+)